MGTRFSRRTALATGAAGLATVGFGGVSAAATGKPPSVSKEYFGQADGEAVYRYTLESGRGMRVRILSYGGIIQTLEAPDRHGHTANVVLGFPTLADYVAKNSPQAGGGVYFGALIGRYANRIAKGTFTLDGKVYHVPVNNNGNSLHGGLVGFNQKVWDVTEIRGGLRLSLTSPDGDQGYPGTLHATVTYTLDQHNRLTIGYTATTDKPTVVNLTNHTYWNLAGEGSGDVYDQKLQIGAARYTPTDGTQIPTGQLAPVHGTPFDFRAPTAIGARIRDHDPQLLIGQGYDLNWVLDHPGSLLPAASAFDPAGGRALTVLTDQPGLQFYSGNFLDGTLVGTSGKVYRQSDGFALETQHFPDSPNHPSFPSTVLRPGQTYRTTTAFALGVL
ncbi:aldose epimerase family protein [Amycolatopsis alkalitolerans]|uniref:Aldose 1-epimerase n=1 Tax=Amycolatopsis alkalitolerans TaxID=2547244 RepID=A0A5C4LVU6_9PSEU|nr:aldose epimerase family protein [Amycolatopsis alkalitolerans]TNC21905.1 galactose mutarotase [Amycolatopsis alkalitolerans]